MTQTEQMKPRIAIFSPLPPTASGIATYNEALAPHLAAAFRVDWVVDPDEPPPEMRLPPGQRILLPEEFEAQQMKEPYEQCLYHIGNSPAHLYMLPLYFRYGGALVMHEVILEGISGHIRKAWSTPSALRSILFDTQPEPIRCQYDLLDPGSQKERLACTRMLLQALISRADGILLHSERAKALLEKEISALVAPVLISAHGAPPPVYVTEKEKSACREQLGLPANHFICGVWGHLQESKGIEEICDALLPLAGEHPMTFLLAGAVEKQFAPVFEALVPRLLAGGVQVVHTGRLEDEAFFRHMDAADAAFALRTHFRGESSGALVNLLARGVPTLVYDIGSFAELPDDAVVKVPVSDVDALTEAVRGLLAYPDRQQTLAAGARRYVESVQWPTRIPDYQALIRQSLRYRDGLHLDDTQEGASP